MNAALTLAASIQPPMVPMPNLGLLMGQTTSLAMCKNLLGLDLLKKMAMAKVFIWSFGESIPENRQAGVLLQACYWGL